MQAALADKAYVYIHRRKTDGLVFYVGKGSGPYRLCQKTGRSRYWKSVAEKHGWTYERIAEGLSDQEALHLECATIAEMRSLGMPLTNMTNGGEGTRGYVQTEDHKKKISIAKIGRGHTEETKAKMRGRVVSEETRAKLSVLCSGFSHTEEARAKISAAQMGEKHHLYDATVWLFQHPEHGIVKFTQHAMAAHYALNRSQLCAIIKGRAKSCGGWKFMGKAE